MATLGVKTFELTQFGELEAGNVYAYPVKASETFKKGNPVELDTNGQVLAATPSANIWGIAWQDAPATALAPCLVLVITPSMVFSASQSNDGAAQVTAQTQVGLACSWKLSSVTGSTTKAVVDTNNTTTPEFTIIALDARDALGDTNGRVLVRVNPAKIIAR